jgi:hypothetical protein
VWSRQRDGTSRELQDLPARQCRELVPPFTWPNYFTFAHVAQPDRAIVNEAIRFRLGSMQ